MTTPTLHRITGRNRWCGPAAVAAITGETTDAAAAIILAATGRRAITSTAAVHLRAALRPSGLTISLAESYLAAAPRQRPTLAAWMRGARNPDATFLVAASHHWLVVRGSSVADSVNRRPVPIRAANLRIRSRVASVFLVHPESTP